MGEVKISPDRLRHAAATQLVNAGFRIAPVQKFLWHKHLSTIMIYARVHDRTVPDDYCAAMSQVEKRLDLLGTQEDSSRLIEGNERGQMLLLYKNSKNMPHKRQSGPLSKQGH
jgi:site-specific recombinase XerC